jgi:hypothetical protein
MRKKHGTYWRLNTGNWDLDKGNKPRLEYEYSYVENFSASILFGKLSDKLVLIPMY